MQGISYQEVHDLPSCPSVVWQHRTGVSVWKTKWYRIFWGKYLKFEEQFG